MKYSARSDMELRTIDGKYELIRELGSGGMGAVYEARNSGTGAHVALKMVNARLLEHSGRAEFARRFRLEQLVGGAIVSQHVARVLDAGIDRSSDCAYLVMELLHGSDLRQLLLKAGPLPEALVLKIASQACIGLQRVHQQHVIHRDVKTANLFLAEAEAGGLVIKLLDFGIAKLREGAKHVVDVLPETKSQSLLGSPLYMSPEQAVSSRSLDARSDLWSLGVVMYEALTGETPHKPQPIGALVVRICSQPAQPIRERRPDISPEVAALVHRALALDPGQRFQSALELQQAIAALLPAGHAIPRAELDAILSTRPRVDERMALDLTQLEDRSTPVPRAREATASTLPSDTPMGVEPPASPDSRRQLRLLNKRFVQLSASVAAVFGLAASTGESAPLDQATISAAATDEEPAHTFTTQSESEPLTFLTDSEKDPVVCRVSDGPSVQENVVLEVEAREAAPEVRAAFRRRSQRQLQRAAPAKAGSSDPPLINHPPKAPEVPLIDY